MLFSLKKRPANVKAIPVLILALLFLLIFSIFIYLLITHQRKIGEAGQAYTIGTFFGSWWYFGIGYCFIMWILSLVVKAEIRLLVGYEDKDSDIDRIAGYISIVSVFMATLIWLLLAFDYWGHAANVELKGAQEQSSIAVETSDRSRENAI